MDCFNRFILKLLITGSLKAYMLTKSGLEFNQQNKTVGTSSDARPWPIVSTLAAAQKKKSMVKHPRLSTAMRVEGASSSSSYSRSDSEPHHRKAWCPWQNARSFSTNRESHAFSHDFPRNKKWMLFSQFMVNSWWELVGGENDHGISLWQGLHPRKTLMTLENSNHLSRCISYKEVR